MIKMALSDKRSNIYKYINIEKKIMVVNVKKELKEYLLELLNKYVDIIRISDKIKHINCISAK